MLKMEDGDDPLLGRPLALYDTVLSSSGEPEGLDIVYLVVGKLTGKLKQLEPGARLNIWGPLGNGFFSSFSPASSAELATGIPPRGPGHLIMVAGGIGQTPFPALAQECLGRRRYGTPARIVPPAEKVTLCYGARNAEFLAGVEDFQRIGVEVHISTDDGTAGHHGLVTELLRRVLEQNNESENGSQTSGEDNRISPEPTARTDAPSSALPLRIVCCGPEPMMAAVAKIARRFGVPCQVSLETPMACGIGICFSCVAKVRQQDGTWDYRRTCVEGPVFDAAEIEF